MKRFTICSVCKINVLLAKEQVTTTTFTNDVRVLLNDNVQRLSAGQNHASSYRS